MTKLHRTFLFVALTTAMASAVCLIGGVGLEYISDRVLPLVPLMIAIPALNNLVGGYASIIAAHTGDPAERKKSKRELAKSIFKVLGINVIAMIILSLGTAVLRDYDFDAGFVVRFVVFVFGAVVIIVIFMFAVAHILDVILRKRRINPDELLIPIITSVADVAMLLLITLAVLTIF